MECVQSAKQSWYSGDRDGGINILAIWRTPPPPRWRQKPNNGGLSARGTVRGSGESVPLSGRQYKAYRGMGSVARMAPDLPIVFPKKSPTR